MKEYFDRITQPGLEGKTVEEIEKRAFLNGYQYAIQVLIDTLSERNRQILQNPPVSDSK